MAGRRPPALPQHTFPTDDDLTLFAPEVPYGAELAARFPVPPIGEAQPPPTPEGLYEENHLFSFGDVAFSVSPDGKKWASKAYYVVECSRFVRKGKLNKKVLAPGEKIDKIVYTCIQGGVNNVSNHAVMLEPLMLFHYRVLVDRFVEDLSVSFDHLRHLHFILCKFYV